MATLNQKIVAERILRKVRKGEKVSMSKEMRGIYSPGFSKQPTRLKNSKGFKELLDKFLPETDLLKIAKEGLKATKIRFSPKGEEIHEKDYATRHKYVETGLKLRGKLTVTDEGGKTTNVFIGNLTIEQQRRLAGEVLRITESGTG